MVRAGKCSAVEAVKRSDRISDICVVWKHLAKDARAVRSAPAV